MYLLEHLLLDLLDIIYNHNVSSRAVHRVIFYYSDTNIVYFNIISPRQMPLL